MICKFHNVRLQMGLAMFLKRLILMFMAIRLRFILIEDHDEEEEEKAEKEEAKGEEGDGKGSLSSRRGSRWMGISLNSDGTSWKAENIKYSKTQRNASVFECWWPPLCGLGVDPALPGLLFSPDNYLTNEIISAQYSLISKWTSAKPWVCW